MPVRDFWAKVSQPTPRPSLLDFAKAAVGVKVPAVEHLVAKASTAEALATMHVATRKRASAAKRIEGEQNAKARELKGARSALDLQLEVNQLRAKLASTRGQHGEPLLLWKHWECLRPLLLVDVRKRNCYRYKVKTPQGAGFWWSTHAWRLALTRLLND